MYKLMMMISFSRATEIKVENVAASIKQVLDM
jgi:hypothetical protein